MIEESRQLLLRARNTICGLMEANTPTERAMFERLCQNARKVVDDIDFSLGLTSERRQHVSRMAVGMNWLNYSAGFWTASIMPAFMLHSDGLLTLMVLLAVGCTGLSLLSPREDSPPH